MRGDVRIGPVYKKAAYFQYSDGTYKQEVGKPEWLGYLGPIILAEEGDTVKVHLKNMATRTYSLHPHGLTYDKANEGMGEDPRSRPSLVILRGGRIKCATGS